MKELDFENICLGVKNNPPKIVFARNATTEQIRDAVAGELLLTVRRSVGAHPTRSINPPANGQPHSEARIQEVVKVVMANSSQLFNPHAHINKMIEAVLARRDNQSGSEISAQRPN